MLPSEKISKSFTAIVEEAEKLIQVNPSEEVLTGLKTIISIAKHQSDIRGVSGGSCKSHKKCSSK